MDRKHGASGLQKIEQVSSTVQPSFHRIAMLEISNPASSRAIDPKSLPAVLEEQEYATQETEGLKELSDAQRNLILSGWNQTEAFFPREKSITQLLEEQASRTPEATALIFDDRSLSYSELNRRANKLAHYLRSLGVKPDSRVAVCAERSIEMVVALLGIIKAGGAYVPLDPSYPSDRLAYMLEDSAPVALLLPAHLTKLFSGHKYTGKMVELSRGGATAWESQPDTNPVSSPGVSASPTNLAYMIYTSGSTGKPKGVMIEHRSLVNRLTWMQDAYRLKSSDSVLQKTPFSFDVSVWEFFWPLLTGARLVMARPEGHKDPEYLVEAIQKYKITTLHFVPSMLQVFVDQAKPDRCSSLLRVIASGEALPAALVRKFFQRLPKVALHNLYGPTETTVDVTAWTCTPDPTLTNIPIGRPIANTRAYILDENQKLLPVGAEGELYIGGVQVGRGYLNRPELTTERFLADPFVPAGRMYRTGDLCRWRSDGAIEYLGRNDFQVKIRGFRIELGEIEARLAAISKIKEVAVIAREETPGDKRLVAYLVAADGAQLRDRELRDELGRDLPDYMVPTSFVLMDKMPTTVNGKLDRGGLPTPSATNQVPREALIAAVPDKTAKLKSARNGNAQPKRVAANEGSYVPPSDTLEVELIEIWEQILGVTHIGIRDDFFQLGGHSLLAARMFAKVEERLQKKLPFATLFRGATIEKLADVIRAEGWTSHWSVLVPIHEQGTKPPLFLVHGLRGNVLTFYGLRHHIPADQPLYGVQADGLGTGRASLLSIPEMAAHYNREIRAVYPHGPYFIGGFSAGGLVAYEMARQLHLAGERVPFLALFDSYVEAAGGYWLKAFYSKRALRMSLLALKASWHGIQTEGLLPILGNKFRNLGVNIRIAAWLVLGKIAGRGEAAHPRFLNPHEAFTRAIRVYSPQPYPGPAISFRSTTLDQDAPDPSEGWARFISGKLQHQEILGEHEDIFREPHIGRLADQLMQALEAAYQEDRELHAETARQAAH
jgi:amino acid adenylation domain-containing protein